ncbi:MAG: hypothetical protein ACYC2Y_01575 [Armatimonadota bacterium]
MRSRRTLAVMLAGLMAVMLAVPATAIDLGNLLKGAGVVLLVNQFGDELNKFVNKLTTNKGVHVEDQTKVVPILSIGQGGYVGAAQVSGPAKNVKKVKAVAQIEAKMDSFRIKALVPVESKDAVKNLKRVSGVGVSAIIDVKL